MPQLDYYVIGYLRTGEGFYVSRHKATLDTPSPRTTQKAHAWRMSSTHAEDMVQRFHQVQARGHHHQDVLHYDVRQAPPRRTTSQRWLRRGPAPRRDYVVLSHDPFAAPYAAQGN